MDYNFKDAKWQMFSFTNFYLSGIQKGIQSWHAATRLGLRSDAFQYRNWAANHETIIVCDGGDSEKLQNIYDELFFGSGFDHDKFHERGLNDALTAIVIVLPDWMYQSDLYNVVNNVNTEHRELRKFMSLRKLAAN